MKKLLCLLLCSFLTISHADFQDAQKNYAQGKFEPAYKEFLTLAKFGNILAQHNVAVMLARGEGVEKNAIKAYAWSNASEIKDNKLSATLLKELSNLELLEAEELLKELHQKYGHNNVKISLGPVNKPTFEEKTKIALKRLNTNAPEYPRDLAEKGIQGWTDITFRVFPDGSVRDIYFDEKLPITNFTIEAMKWAEKSKYSFSSNGTATTIEQPRYASQRVDFHFKNFNEFSNEFGHTKKQEQFLKQLITDANKDDINAQYTYAVLFDTFLHRKGEISAKQVNKWLFNAAQLGVNDAQYRLGRNIYSGNACKIDKQKGLDWILHAAQTGHSGAEFMTYQLLQNKTVVNHSNQSAFYWLEQAANNGNKAAQMRYANEIALLNKPTKIQLKAAVKHLKDYSQKLYKNTQWYQTNALIQNKLNKHSKALRSIKVAIKRAKKADWDLTELLHQKNMILENKNT